MKVPKIIFMRKYSNVKYYVTVPERRSMVHGGNLFAQAKMARGG